MSPNATRNFFPLKPSKFLEEAIDSVTDRSDFPPNPTKLVEKSSVSPEKLVMQLVFTQFGLSPVNNKASTELSLSPAKPYTMPPSSFPFSLLKQDSPTSSNQANMKTNNGAPKDRKHCCCKQSRCLKLYCECFAAGGYCDGCSCHGCRNNVKNEGLRQVAMEIILERNPNAFRPKITSGASSTKDNVDDTKDSPMVGKRYLGCHCKKTECLKNYCECFRAKVLCSENCKCVDCKNSEEYVEKVTLSESDYNCAKICNNFEGYEKSVVVSGGSNTNANISKNFEGSDEREAIANSDNSKTNICKHFEGHHKEMPFHGTENNHTKIDMKWANAAISAAIGLSGPSIMQSQTSRKRNLQEFLGLNVKDPPIQRFKNHQKENPLRVSNSLSALSVDPIDNVRRAAILGYSKSHCSGRFTDIIQERDVEELCSVLVLVSEGDKRGLGI